MKFIVDSLPYYGERCPFFSICKTSSFECPRHWDKDTVCSDANPRECEWLKEDAE